MINKFKLRIITFLEFFFSKLWKKRIYKLQQSLNIRDLDERVIEPEILILKYFLKNSDVVFDVGANVGQYTFEFETHVVPQNVFSFEPITDSFLRLNRLFKNCSINKIALSDKIGFSNFKIPIINSVAFMTRGSLNTTFIEKDENRSIVSKVRIDTLDNFCLRKNISQLNFLKIDVEGHEFNVIKGGINSLKKYNPTILIEIEQRHHDYPINDIFVFLKSLGYEIYFYNHNFFGFQNITGFDVEKHQNENQIKTFNYINNFLCIHNSNSGHLKTVTDNRIW